MWQRIQEYTQSIMSRDPAARNMLEVWLCYPSVHALLWYRVSNFLWRHKIYLLGRLISQFARAITGIEIHPGATIGKNLFIDHGMGVVIGESSVIGDDVTLYHGVTLGGMSPWNDVQKQKQQKRHPTLESRVVVGAGSVLLGDIVLGEGAKVGANSVLTKSLAKSSTYIGSPAALVKSKSSKRSKLSSYGIESLSAENTLLQRIEKLEKELERVQKEKDQRKQDS